MNIPEPIIVAAEELVGLYGSNIVFLGKAKGKEVYEFVFPEDEDTGFPVVFLFNPETRETQKVTGQTALKILSAEITD